MNTSKKIKNCANYKAIDQEMISHPMRGTHSGSCKDCVYFSSRNCGMDAADSIEPPVFMM